jgi:hypothetical protein
MAEDATNQDEANLCMPCRGTGKVISGLGGSPHELPCPWCDGTGHRIPGRDAQESPAESRDAQESPAESQGAQESPAESQRTQA